MRSNLMAAISINKRVYLYILIVMRHTKIAVYLDYQNVYHQYVSRQQIERALNSIEQFIDRMAFSSSFVVKKAYTYKEDPMIGTFHSWFVNHKWKIEFGPEGRDIDTKMTNDIAFDCGRSAFTAYVVISGDTHFIPALDCIRKARKTSYVLACPGTYRLQDGVMHHTHHGYVLPGVCGRCKGYGFYNGDKQKRCWDCEGRGM